MGTKQNPVASDCYHSALPDEPLFVLLARDPQAPDLVRRWGQDRSILINQQRRPVSDSPRVREAYDLAALMEEWRDANDGRWRTEQAPPSINAELLAALKLFVAGEDDWNSRDGTFDDPLTDAYHAAKAAIAKAEGRS